MNKIQTGSQLLPVYFKKIAFGIIITTVLFEALSYSKILMIDKELLNTISRSGILISLLLLALTRSKIEDELTLNIRIRAFAGSFAFGVGILIVEPFVNLIFDGSFSSDIGSTQLIMTMLCFYFLMFFKMKKNR